MAQTPKEIVTRCLKFENPQRMPRDLWLLPWAEIHYPEMVRELKERFPSDFQGTIYTYPPSPRIKGDPYKIGEYIDEWGCVFTNIHEGVIGEVKSPIIQEISDWKSVKPPYEQLPTKIRHAYDMISRFYEKTDKFIMAGCCPRPWERYQFLRGTMNAMIDVMMPDKGGAHLLKVIHDFYMKELEFWVKADVDAIFFMDDWGGQKQLLIPPKIWRELFKPLYKDYCNIAHSHNKFVFMHSDGYIAEIYEDLIELGVDAINSQLFCMDMANLAQKAKGRITFWGEIDRQHVLPAKDIHVARDAVREVAHHFYDPAGGIIAQFEFGVGTNPATTLVVFEEWEHVQQEFA